MEKYLEKANVVIDTSIKPTEDKPRLLHVFHNTVQSCKMVTPKGKTLVFIGGKFYTDLQEDIDWLNSEIALGMPHLRVEKGHETILEEDLDPENVQRKRHIAEYLAKQNKAMDKDNDMGSSVQGNLKVQTSRDLEGASPDSNSPVGGRVIKISPTK